VPVPDFVPPALVKGRDFWPNFQLTTLSVGLFDCSLVAETLLLGCREVFFGVCRVRGQDGPPALLSPHPVASRTDPLVPFAATPLSELRDRRGALAGIPQGRSAARFLGDPNGARSLGARKPGHGAH